MATGGDRSGACESAWSVTIGHTALSRFGDVRVPGGPVTQVTGTNVRLDVQRHARRLLDRLPGEAASYRYL
jgi:hypothetical protein